MGVFVLGGLPPWVSVSSTFAYVPTAALRSLPHKCSASACVRRWVQGQILTPESSESTRAGRYLTSVLTACGEANK